MSRPLRTSGLLLVILWVAAQFVAWFYGGKEAAATAAAIAGVLAVILWPVVALFIEVSES